MSGSEINKICNYTTCSVFNMRPSVLISNNSWRNVIKISTKKSVIGSLWCSYVDDAVVLFSSDSWIAVWKICPLWRNTFKQTLSISKTKYIDVPVTSANCSTFQNMFINRVNEFTAEVDSIRSSSKYTDKKLSKILIYTFYTNQPIRAFRHPDNWPSFFEKFNKNYLYPSAMPQVKNGQLASFFIKSLYDSIDLNIVLLVKSTVVFLPEKWRILHIFCVLLNYSVGSPSFSFGN